MKEIPLTRGQVALVDDEDFDWLMQWKWRTQSLPSFRGFYAARGVGPRGQHTTVYMHRLILGLQPGDGRQGDHINHNTLDNRRSNLRIVTLQENRWNIQGTKGFYYDPRKRKYRAEIWVNNKKKHLKDCDTPEEAHQAYLDGKARYHRIPERRVSA